MGNVSKWISILSLASSALISARATFAQSDIRPTLCPDLKSDQAITEFRRKILRPEPDSDYSHFQDPAQLKKCFPSGIPACFKPLEAYLEAKNSRPDDYTQTEDPKSDPRQQMPEELLISGKNDHAYVFRTDVEKIAKKKGWPTVRYKSRLSGGFESTPSLLMIEVPGSSLKPPVLYDRFINLTLKEDEGKKSTDPVPHAKLPTPRQLRKDEDDLYPMIYTMVAVDHSQAGEKPKILFQKFSRTTRSEHFTPEGDQDKLHCLSCHPSGLREISPLGFSVDPGEKQLPPDAWKMVQRINADMEKAQNYGMVKLPNAQLKELATEAHFGPRIPLTQKKIVRPDGSEEVIYPTRTKAFIEGEDGMSGCAYQFPVGKSYYVGSKVAGIEIAPKFTSSPPINWNKVAQAMDCGSCHDGQYRGQLEGTGLQYKEIKFKILGDKSMPLGMHVNPMEHGGPDKPVIDELNTNERIALMNCLDAEFKLEQANFLESLLNEPCEDNSKPKDAKAWTPILKSIQHPSCQEAI